METAEMEIKQEIVECPICKATCYAAQGRGLCQDCFITFPIRYTRKQLLSHFAERYYMSKQSGFYHREGCKYIKNINPENFIIVSEPIGKPCRCTR